MEQAVRTPGEGGSPKQKPKASILGGAREPGATRRRLAWLGPAASIALFIVSLTVLWSIVSDADPAALRQAFTAASGRQIGLALLLVALSYTLLTAYDALALRQLGVAVPYRTTALASFTSYAVSFTLGFPLLTAGTVRYWIYAPKGLSAGTVASLTVIAGFTFWLGMGAVLASSLLWDAGSLAALTYTSIKVNQAIGLAAACAVIAYLVWVSLRRRSVTIQGWRLELPGFRLSLAQMALGAGEVCAAAAVLYVLLPGQHSIPFATFLAVYVLGAMLGIASHAPGGVGVFEATILLALSGLAREPVLGALLLFRLVYYLVPFVAALALLGAYEISKRMRSTSQAFQKRKGSGTGEQAPASRRRSPRRRRD